MKTVKGQKCSVCSGYFMANSFLDKTPKLEYMEFEQCTGEEWDKLPESERDFIDFGEGFTYARRIK